METKIFKAYDIRGIYPEEINEDSVERIAKAYAEVLKPKEVVVGHDVRTSGPSLTKAVIKGLTEMGVDVIDIGVIPTDMLYFAVANYGYDGGMSITGSHTPRQFNGIKIVKSKAEPVYSENGFTEICELTVKNDFKLAEKPGKVIKKDFFEDYIQKLLTFVDVESVKRTKFRMVANMNFGAGGRAIKRLAEILDIELEKLNFEPDGTFPKGRPDPMIPELRMETKELIKSTDSDLGAAWDADADRCLMHDEYGRFVDAYYMGTLLSQIFLKENKGAAIVHDPRLIWAVDDAINENGGKSIIIRAGHSFIKGAMKTSDAVFGMETSGHFFFKDYFYCDNGMIPFLIIINEMAKTGKKLSELIDPIRFKYPVSEEVNFKVNDAEKVLKDLEEKNQNGKIDHIDGLSVEYADWRFNVRSSHTGEILIRLNVEAKTREILDPMKAEIIKIIKQDISEV